MINWLKSIVFAYRLRNMPWDKEYTIYSTYTGAIWWVRPRLPAHIPWEVGLTARLSEIASNPVSPGGASIVVGPIRIWPPAGMTLAALMPYIQLNTHVPSFNAHEDTEVGNSYK